jgi:hypothetical protein
VRSATLAEFRNNSPARKNSGLKRLLPANSLPASRDSKWSRR